MEVRSGVPSHNASRATFAIARSEDELASPKVRSTPNQALRMLRWAEPFPARTWAIESANGLGFLLVQPPVAAGETVVDVPTTLVSCSRVLATGRAAEADPNDRSELEGTKLGSKRRAGLKSLVECCAARR